MGPIGVTEMIFIFVLALLIFGPKKLPELGRSFGKGMAEFKRASNELRSTFQREMDSLESETRQVKESTREVSRDLNTNFYDDSHDSYNSDYETPNLGAASPYPGSASPTLTTEPAPNHAGETETTHAASAPAPARNGSGDSSGAKPGSSA
jgi:TatA/E family protein of Tat protein translocase